MCEEIKSPREKNNGGGRGYTRYREIVTHTEAARDIQIQATIFCRNKNVGCLFLVY